MLQDENDLFWWDETGKIHLHSGQQSKWLINFRALNKMGYSLSALARIAAEYLPPYGSVFSVPTGGDAIAREMRIVLSQSKNKEESTSLPTLLVDDVWTTGNSMREVRARLKEPVIGLVIFARAPVEPWVTALFQMPAPRHP